MALKNVLKNKCLKFSILQNLLKKIELCCSLYPSHPAVNPMLATQAEADHQVDFFLVVFLYQAIMFYNDI